MIEAALFCAVTHLPVMRTRAGGNCWLSIGVKAGHGRDAQFVWLAVFGADAEALAGLQIGARLYVEGKNSVSVYGKDGEPRPSINLACSFARPTEIGRAKPKPDAAGRTTRRQHEAPIDQTAPAFDDEMPF